MNKINNYEEFKEAIGDYLKYSEEYSTSHIDAGNNYIYFLFESNITANDVNKRSDSYKYPNKYQLTDDDILSIFENNDFDMVAGSIFIPPMNENQYYLDSFPVGEIEEQLYAEQFELSKEQFDAYMSQYSTDRNKDAYIKNSHFNWYAYINTDAVWYAIHTRKI